MVGAAALCCAAATVIHACTRALTLPCAMSTLHQHNTLISGKPMARPEAGAEEEVDWDMPVGDVLDSLQVCHSCCSNVLYLPASQSLHHHPARQGG